MYKDKKNNALTKAIIYILGHGDGKTRVIDIILRYNLNLTIMIKALKILKKRKLISFLYEGTFITGDHLRHTYLVYKFSKFLKTLIG